MSVKKSENSYRSILKGTSVFGGVQVFQVLVNLVRGKFVAMFLGPEGMGIASLFTASSTTIQRFSSLGLNLAVVKEVSAQSEDPAALSSLLTVTRRMISMTSLLGALICVVLCVPLSRATFGTPDMAWQFVLLGVAVGLSVAAAGKLSVLQGLHDVRRLSKASLVGGLCGLVVGVPLYWLFGNRGIVPAMVALSLAMYLFYDVSLRRSIGNDLPRRKLSWRESMPLMKPLLALGVLMMASDLIGSGCTYLLNIFLRVRSDYNTVGLYQAANSVTGQYAGMVFAAMAMDYFPRLSKAASDNKAMAAVVCRQQEIVSLIIAPAMCLLILTAPVIIPVLLTEQYRPVLPLMRWFGLGVLMQALAYPMGYISFAKGNKKLFFWLEGVFGNLLTLLLSCLGFGLFGLNGLGYALVADHLICMAVYYSVNRRLYGFRFSGAALRQTALAIMMGGGCFASSLISDQVVSYILMAAVFIVAAAYGVIALRRRLSLVGEEEDVP